MSEKRQIILDTETTGLEPRDGHRIIEIGCVEMVNRQLTHNNYHVYIRPDREVDEEAIQVHGITNEFLADKPVFADIAEEFIEFIRGAELIIHNAPFDVGFIDHEFGLLSNCSETVANLCSVIDTLPMARKMFPGQRASLDALCKRYDIDNSHRELHGALLDSEILADVYLAMTGGQITLNLDASSNNDQSVSTADYRRLESRTGVIPVQKASEQEIAAHEALLANIEEAAGEPAAWKSIINE